MKNTSKSFSYILLVFLGFMVVMGCKDNSKPAIKSSGDPAIDELTQQIKKSNGDPDLYYQRALLYRKKESFDLAIADVMFALKADSLNLNYYYLLSDTYLNYGNSKEAMNALLTALHIEPESVSTLLKMGELRYIIEDYDGSILNLNEAVRLDPQNAKAYFILGLDFVALLDQPRSINAFQTAVEMDSKLTDAWLYLGDIYDANGDPAALKYYESAILSDPESVEPKHAKAFYLQNHGDVAGALEIYKEIIRDYKDYEDAYLNSGYLYMDMDSLDRAWEQFDLLVGNMPTKAEGYKMRGIISKMKGNKEAALKDLQSAANLSPNDKSIAEELEKLKNE